MEEAGKVIQQNASYFFDNSDVINISSFNRPNNVILTIEWRKIEKLSPEQLVELSKELKEVLDKHLQGITL